MSITIILGDPNEIIMRYRKSSNKRPERLFKVFDLERASIRGGVNKKGAFIRKLNF